MHSKVGIISNNRRKWVVVALAGYSLNVAIVPMYKNQRLDDLAHVLKDLGCASLFCSMANVHLRARTEALLRAPLIHQDNVICLNVHKHKPHLFLRAMAWAEWELHILGNGGRGTRRSTTTTTVTTAIMTKMATTAANGMPEDLGIVVPTPDDLANVIYMSSAAGGSYTKEVFNFMDAVGIPFCKGYGLTEIVLVVAFNNLAGAVRGWLGG